MAHDGGAGGAAGEQGSRHRNGVAAFLAVLGLVGHSIDGHEGAIPVRIHLESDAAVDDIVCTMRDGSTWYIQSKRRAGNDQSLKDAIQQWVQQELRTDDRIVLSARSFHGLLNDLQRWIDRVRSDRGAPIPESHQDRLDLLAQKLEEAGADDGSLLLEKVILFEVAAEEPSDAEQRTAVAHLGGGIVDVADAPAAFEAIRNHMQLVASRREWTGIDDWLEAVEGAGLQVYRDGQGSAGAQRAARLHALSAYRSTVANRLDLLDLSALRPGLGMIHSDDLLSGWEVDLGDDFSASGSLRKADLYAFARRNPRFVLTGHPGVGKSEAMRQIAAAMASDPTAPVPILVDLRDVVSAVDRAEAVDLDLLLSRPSRMTPGLDPAEVFSVLSELLMAGEAVLLVDGLDEARGRRGVVAAGLARLIERFPADTGVILSTRPSAVDAVRVLDFKAAELRTPENLQKSLKTILAAIADQLVLEDREVWLADRVRELNSGSVDHPDVWKIPLLATLATLRIADNKRPASSSAKLLNEVITDSVKTWEQNKAKHHDDFDDQMRPEMLLDGFVTIGRLINKLGSLARGAAVDAVAENLVGWGDAQKVRLLRAEQIVHFWDERVGVFIDQDGQMSARSRQFAELADVRWITLQSVEVKQSWLTAALLDPDLSHTIGLATAQDSEIREALIGQAERGGAENVRARAVMWLTDFWQRWIDVDDRTASRIVVCLAEAAEDDLDTSELGHGDFIDRIKHIQRGNDGSGWQCVLALVNADLPLSIAELRNERVSALPLSPSRRAIAELLIGLRAARREERKLNDGERDLLFEIMYGQRPAPSTTSRSDEGVLSFDQRERYVVGVGDVIVLAVEHVDELGDGAPDAFYAMAHGLNMAVFGRVDAALRARGHKDPKPPFAGLTGLAEGWLKDHEDHHGLGWALRSLSDLFPEDVPLSVPEMWRQTQLGDFMHVLGWGESEGGTRPDAVDEDPAFIAVWFSAILETFGIAGPLAAAEARRILNSTDESDDFLDLLVTPSLTPAPKSHQVDCETATQIVHGFGETSSMVASSVFRIILNADCSSVADAVLALPRRMTWESRFLATIAAIANASDTEVWIGRCGEGGSAERSALAAIVRQLDGDRLKTIEVLAKDRDAVVRSKLDVPIDGAEEWTCRFCYEIRPMTVASCPKCKQSPSWL
jgi:hypothetical protein